MAINLAKDYTDYIKITEALAHQCQFECESRLGKGAFGVVVKAKPMFGVDSHKEFAIKVLHIHKGRQEEYLKRELELLRNLQFSERNVIKYFNHWTLQVGDAERLCIQMELCSVSLDWFIYENKISGARITEAQGQPRFYQHVFPQILNGLDAIHSLGWVHRDIHPGNILIANPNPRQIRDIQVKIADFGLARRIGIAVGWSPALTDAPKLDLSPHIENEYFRAPELSSKTYDFKVDVYSAGMVLYFICRYLNDIFKWGQEMKALREGKIDLKQSLKCHKDDENLCSLIEKLLYDDPSKRFNVRDAMEYLRHTKTTNFFARKDGEECDDVSRCRLKAFTLSSLKEAVKCGTGVEADKQDLRQERVVNGEKKRVKLNSDEDVEAMFQSADEHKRDVEILVREKQHEDIVERDLVGPEESYDDSSSDSL